MKIFKNKNLIQKMFIALILVIFISVSFSSPVHAIDLEKLGGKLLNATLNLFVAIGDGVMGLIQDNILGMDESIVNINTETSRWAKFWAILGAITITAICVLSVIASGGTALAVGLGIAKVVAISLGTTVLAFPLATSIIEGMLPDSFYLPMYEVSPYEIFSNKLLILDTNFFDPQENLIIEEIRAEDTGAEWEIFDKDFFNKHEFTRDGKKLIDLMEEKDPSGEYSDDLYDEMYQYDINGGISLYCLSVEELASYFGYSEENAVTIKSVNISSNTIDDYLQMYAGKTIKFDEGEVGSSRKFKLFWMTADGYVYDVTGGYSFNYSSDGEEKYISYWLKDGDSFARKKVNVVTYESDESQYSTAGRMKSTISSWFYTLRNIAIVVSMLVLLFTGIKIVTTSTAGEKAKYKQMLIDWLISICLIFIMQYIMIFANYIIQKVTELIDSIQFETMNFDSETDAAVIDALEKADEKIQGNKLYTISDDTIIGYAWDTLIGDTSKSSMYFLDSAGNQASSKDSAEIFCWPTSNFLGMSRMEMQLLDTEDGEKTPSIGWKLIYVLLVVYTVIFLFTYLKRIVYLAFLTIIAPIVALTYPIDKITDGKAQAFDMWVKEYIFNLLIQPMHLLLYMILIGSAMDFASTEILYTVVALGFMVPAEKLVRKFFGFEKAQTPGLLAGPAGAALMMSGINKLTHMGHHRPGGGPNGGKSGESKENDIKNYGANAEYSKYGEASALLGNNEQRTTQRTRNSANGGNQGQSTDTYDLSTGSYSVDLNNGSQGQTIDVSGLNLDSDNYSVDSNNINEYGLNDNYAIDSNNLDNVDGYNSNNIYGTNYIPDLTALNTNPTRSGVNARTWINSNTPINGIRQQQSRQQQPRQQQPRQQQQQPRQQQQQPRQHENKRSIMGAVGAYAHQKLANRGQKIKDFKLGRAAMGVATGIAGGAVGLTAGAIAGIAGGDPSKAFQYGTAGAVGGYAATKGFGTGIYDEFAPTEADKEAIAQAYYGSEYQKHKREQAEKEFKKKSENIQYLQTHLDWVKNKEDAQSLMNSNVTQQCLNAGIYKMEDIATVHQLVNEGKSSRESIMLASFAKDMKDNPKSMGEKTYDDYIKKYTRNFADGGYSTSQSKKMAQDLMDNVQNIYFKKKEQLTVDDL